MARINLTNTYKNLATYSASYVGTSQASITPPRWNSGRKSFFGYWRGNTEDIFASGTILYGGSSDISSTEKWKNVADGALVVDGSTAVAELAYDGGVWLSDYASRTPLDADHPFSAPKKELYRFIGCYSTNGTAGTKYINADGTPTDAMLALVPTQGSDVSIYAVYELASVKITINSTYGDYDTKTIYQSVTADADGKFGYFTDSTCSPESRIYGIRVPTRELYAWGGLRKSSSATSELWANADGTFTDAFLNRAATAVTAYGNFWTQVSYKITVNANGGVAPVAAYYTDKTNGGIFADWLVSTPELDALPIPTYNARRFLGYFNSTTGTTEYAGYDGTITNALKTRRAATTIYAKWRAANATVTLNAGGGTGGGSIYFDSTDGKFFDATSATVTSVEIPEYPGNTFVGYFDSQDGGNIVIDANGAISQSYAPTGSDVLYAHYQIGKSTIDIERGEGAGGTERVYYEHSSRKFFSDSEMTDEITAVTLPSLRLFDCNGLFSESSGGSQAVTSSGAFNPAWEPTDEFVTIYAQYSRRCYEAVIDADGGSVDVSAIYHAPTPGGSWYSDDALTNAVTNVGTPTRTGYTFGGFFYGGVKVIGENGDILSAAFIGEDYTAIARWTARHFTLTFNAAGGTSSFSSKTVTFGAAIGALPTATKKGARFVAWKIDGAEITAQTPYEVDDDATAIAQYENTFGSVIDYFGLASSALIPESSDSGENRPHVVAYNAPGEAPATETGVRWMNPRVTYQVVGNMNLSVTLGGAYGAGASSTGYMITSVEVHAAIGEPKRVTVSAVANEGANAIQTYAVSFALSPRHRPQDVAHALSLNGYDLQEVTTVATCDPVVIAEGGRPCASDICHGRIEVNARVADYGDGAGIAAGSGFVFTNEPATYSGTGYKSVSVSARKDL